jgi:hypothetical protein
MYSRPLVPAGFVVPERLDCDGFTLRPLTIHDVVKDYDAVMTSADRLVGSMNPADTWPRGLTLEDNLIDLGWHYREYTSRHSFAYTVVSADGMSCLGCTYIYPSDKAGYDAMAFYWVRTSETGSGLEDRLGGAFRKWIARVWPFERVAYPGRDIDWRQWQALPPAAGHQ